MKFHAKTWALASALTLSAALIGCTSEEKPAETGTTTTAPTPGEPAPAPSTTTPA
ncbi:MAG: fasciclin domain-containing protein, partial [Isosphaeraceae bacterium]|nr:fasciclin domain-containing protein [Isosphaeraceae bacterium]